MEVSSIERYLHRERFHYIFAKHINDIILINIQCVLYVRIYNISLSEVGTNQLSSLYNIMFTPNMCVHVR